MKNIVIFYGSKGVGKDTCSDAFINHAFFDDKTITQLSFAESLKRTVWELFMYKIKDEDRIFGAIDKKEEPIPGWNMPAELKDKYGYSEANWTGRRLLQWFGTDVCRTVYSSIWVDKLMEEIDECDEDFITITDCRFINEYEALNEYKDKYNVTYIQVLRDEAENEFSGHVSEQGISSFVADIVFENSGTIDNLKTSIGRLYSDKFKL